MMWWRKARRHHWKDNEYRMLQTAALRGLVLESVDADDFQ